MKSLCPRPQRLGLDLICGCDYRSWRLASFICDALQPRPKPAVLTPEPPKVRKHFVKTRLNDNLFECELCSACSANLDDFDAFACELTPSKSMDPKRMLADMIAEEMRLTMLLELQRLQQHYDVLANMKRGKGANLPQSSLASAAAATGGLDLS